MFSGALCPLPGRTLLLTMMLVYTIFLGYYGGNTITPTLWTSNNKIFITSSTGAEVDKQLVAFTRLLGLGYQVVYINILTAAGSVILRASRGKLDYRNSRWPLLGGWGVPKQPTCDPHLLEWWKEHWGCSRGCELCVSADICSSFCSPPQTWYWEFWTTLGLEKELRRFFSVRARYCYFFPSNSTNYGTSAVLLY